jgi:hypothetical protein
MYAPFQCQGASIHAPARESYPKEAQRKNTKSLEEPWALFIKIGRCYQDIVRAAGRHAAGRNDFRR